MILSTSTLKPMNSQLLDSRVAVVTGSSSGLGCNLCRTLSSKGWRVHGIDINEAPPEMDKNLYHHHICDIASFQEIDHLCKQISSSVELIDLLVNCAGIMPTSLIARLDPLVAEKTYKVNVISPLYISRLLTKKLKHSENPKVINICSIASELAISGEAIYASSKAALSQASKIMSIEFARYGIGVYDVRPALVKTPMTEHLTESQRGEMLKKQALQKELYPKDFTNCIMSIIDMPLETTGSIIYVGGISN